MSLVNKIKELCHEKKISVQALERAVGLSNGQIRRWDEVSPKVENLMKVADYFHVSMDYLLERENEIMVDKIETIAAHKDGETWTSQEMAEIEQFMEFIKMKRQQ